MELRLPCNVHEELDNQKSPFAALTQSCKEEKTQVSSIKSESVPEAREKHTELSASKSTYPADTLRCEGKHFVGYSSVRCCYPTVVFFYYFVPYRSWNLKKSWKYKIC